MIFKIVVPDNIDVDTFNVGGRVKANGAAPIVQATDTTLPPTTPAVFTTTAPPKEIPEEEEE